MRRANYDVIEQLPDKVVIRDVGPWDLHPSITNDAELVVLELLDTGIVRSDTRLFYYDSDGVLDELCHDGRAFTGFAPGPR